jgi:peptide/nickel transport system substrate-binding protein
VGGAHRPGADLLRSGATEVDRGKREAVLHGLQQLVAETAMVAPMYKPAFVNGVGRRVDESGLGLIAGYAFSAPCEGLKLTAK